MASFRDTEFLIQALPLLLHDHDCLVIPKFGGFVAHPVPARYDTDKGEWVPPGRNVAFNPKLTVRDGLLEQEIRRATGCRNEAATELIDSEVDALKAHLESGGTRDISGLGRLYLTANGTIGFAPEARLGERYAPPGLGRIAWIDLSEERTAEAETPGMPIGQGQPSGTSEKGGQEEEEKDLPWMGSWVRTAAAILLLPMIVGGSLWWGQGQGAQFEFLSFSEPEPTDYLPRIEGEDIRFPDTEATESLAFLDPEAPDIDPSENGEAMMVLPTPQPLSSGCSHHVIGGTFSEMTRAASMARRLEALGYATSILPGPGGAHRVSAGCFDDRSAALKFRRGLKVLHGMDQAWILQI